jgi:branched-chain amino acid transport system substrate-binding protein
MISLARQVTFALCLALSAAAPSWAQGVTPRTVVLGQSAPLSGPHRAEGEAVRSGVLAYLRRLNDAGGLFGRRVELATLDDAGDPERALANTRRFIEEFDVFALLAYPARSATPEVLDLVSAARMPMIAPLTGDSRARRAGRSIFAVCAGYGQELEDLVGYYAALGLRRMAILRPENSEGAGWAATFRSALAKRDLPAPRDIVVTATGITAAARGAKSAAADVLVVALPAPRAADMVRALRQAGAGAQIVVTSASDAASLAKALGTAGAGVALSQVVPPLDRVSLPVVAEYRAAYEAEAGAPAYSPASFEAFLGAKVLIEAMRRVGPAPTKDKLRLALEAMSAHDTGGHLVGYSRNARRGSDRIYLLAIGADGGLMH